MFYASTGLRNAMLDSGSFKSLVDGGRLAIYSGPVPTSADAELVVGNVELVSIELPAGLTFAGAADNGVIVKAAAETWAGTCIAGTATFYRFYAPDQDLYGSPVVSDTEDASTQAVRFQGHVGTAGADLNLASVALSDGITQTIDYFSAVLPTY